MTYNLAFIRQFLFILDVVESSTSPCSTVDFRTLRPFNLHGKAVLIESSLLVPGETTAGGKYLGWGVGCNFIIIRLFNCKSGTYI